MVIKNFLCPANDAVGCDQFYSTAGLGRYVTCIAVCVSRRNTHVILMSVRQAIRSVCFQFSKMNDTCSICKKPMLSIVFGRMRRREDDTSVDQGVDDGDGIGGDGGYEVTTCILNSSTILSVGGVLPIATTSTLIVYSPLVSNKLPITW